MSESKSCPYSDDIIDIKTRIALLEREEERFRKMNEEAKDSRHAVWQQLNALRTDLSTFQLTINTQLSSQILKIWIKVAAIGAVVSILTSILTALVLLKIKS